MGEVLPRQERVRVSALVRARARRRSVTVKAASAWARLWSLDTHYRNKSRTSLSRTIRLIHTIRNILGYASMQTGVDGCNRKGRSFARSHYAGGNTPQHRS